MLVHMFIVHSIHGNKLLRGLSIEWAWFNFEVVQSSCPGILRGSSSLEEMVAFSVVWWTTTLLVIPCCLCFNHWVVTEDGKIEHQVRDPCSGGVSRCRACRTRPLGGKLELLKFGKAKSREAG